MAHLGYRFHFSSSQLETIYLSPPYSRATFWKLGLNGYLLPGSKYYLASLLPSSCRNGLKDAPSLFRKIFLLSFSLSLQCDALNSEHLHAWLVVPSLQILNALGSQIPMGCNIRSVLHLKKLEDNWKSNPIRERCLCSQLCLSYLVQDDLLAVPVSQRLPSTASLETNPKILGPKS